MSLFTLLWGLLLVVPVGLVGGWVEEQKELRRHHHHMTMRDGKWHCACMTAGSR